MTLDDKTDAFIYSFISNLETDERSVFNLKETIPSFAFDGGGTDVGKSLVQLFEVIKKSGRVTHPSVLIINDGQDRVRMSDPPCKVSALILGTTNRDLCSLCNNSGGKGFQLLGCSD